MAPARSSSFWAYARRRVATNFPRNTRLRAVEPAAKLSQLQKNRIGCRDILHKVLRRCVGLALIVAIATLQCVSWADVDDARQPTRDGRAVVAATGVHGGVGVARAKGTAPIMLSGMVTDTFVLIAPPVLIYHEPSRCARTLL